MRGRKTDLDVDLEWSPVFNSDCVQLVWRVQSGAELSTEYAYHGRLN